MSFKNGGILFLSLICTLYIRAQDYSDLWEEYYSYLDITDFSIAEDKLYAASDNAIFSLNFNTNEIEEITTINGLSGELISSIYYSTAFNLLLIGYETGLIDVYLLDEKRVLSVIDIINKPTIQPNRKKINHFFEIEGIVLISTDFGVSEYDLSRLEFGDTFFIGLNGSQTRVTQTTVFNGFIYASCLDNNGIKKAELFNPDLISSSEWTTVASGNYIAIQSTESSLATLRTNRTLYEILNDNLRSVTSFSENPTDMRYSFSKITVTTDSKMYVFDSEFNSLFSTSVNSEFPTRFTVSMINDFDEVFIGTKGNTRNGQTGFGVLRSNKSLPNEYISVHPDGPLLNNIFEVATPNNEIWAVFGGYSRTLNPFESGARYSGYSHFKERKWINTVYQDVASAFSEPLSLSHIAVNPFDSEQIYLSSYWSGLLEINQGLPVQIYNKSNSTLVPFLDDIYFLSASDFDRDGALWIINGRVENPLNRYKDGQWSSYDFTSIIDPPGSNIGFYDLAVSRDNIIFIGSFNYGLIAFRNTNGSQQLVFADTEENGFPSDQIRSLAFDNNGQLWIGTAFGLRVLYNPSNFFENQEVNNIVILEDGIPRELLENQVITDIVVDGSNNKWVGTGDAGVFYFSPDGQETIYHFTKDNSPLPSNSINDISIDQSNGSVYFATSNGLLAFGSGGSSPTEDLESAYVYPNPVRPEYDILGYDDLNNITNGVKIKGITENVNIKITDIEGNLVAEAQSNINRRSSTANYNFAIDGGTAIWNGKNLANNVVATGVYLILISDLESLETKVLKLLIVR